MAQPLKVLIVDDALVIRKVIAEAALECGWTITSEAGDGVEAVESYKKDRPDLVTLDVIMPRMDGLETIKLIRAFDPQARIIMISAFENKEQVSQLLRFGAYDFILKPFDKEKIHNLFVQYRKILES